MKYVIIIPDGCADEPQESLGGKTPLQAAHLPNMDRIVRTGTLGRADNVPPSLTPASDVATLSLFGYDPMQVYTGRAPLETAAMGITLGPHDWAIRCNLVHIDREEMRDFTSGHIPSEDGRPLIEALHQTLGGEIPAGLPGHGSGRLEFHPGVSYRNILVYRSHQPAPFSPSDTKAQPPHDIPDRPIAEHLPRGPGSELLRSLMEKSRPILASHPVNQRRLAQGKKPATQCWLWGQGKAPSLETFQALHQIQGAIISAVDLVRGVGALLGWTRIHVPTATGYLDTDYPAKGRAGIDALATHDLVCVHIEAPDEASHEGKADEKVKALERIDTHIVGPLLEALPSHGAWRILVSPDHRTTLRTRAHAYGEVPFAMAGTGITPSGATSYDEVAAAASPLVFPQGHRLMTRFLGSQT